MRLLTLNLIIASYLDMREILHQVMKILRLIVINRLIRLFYKNKQFQQTHWMNERVGQVNQTLM